MNIKFNNMFVVDVDPDISGGMIIFSDIEGNYIGIDYNRCARIKCKKSSHAKKHILDVIESEQERNGYVDLSEVVDKFGAVFYRFCYPDEVTDFMECLDEDEFQKYIIQY